MRKKFSIDGLCCANCSAKIEEKIAKLDGVSDVSLNFMTMKLHLEFDESREAKILALSQKIVDEIEPGAIIRI